MTYTLIILAATFLASVWIAFDLLGPVLSTRRTKPNGEGAARAAGPQFYKPIARLFDAEDFEYLAGHADLAGRLSNSRGAAMRLYLVELRRDFLEVWNVCRLLAPISTDSRFVSRLSQQYWSFHWAYVCVYAYCLVPSLARRPVMVDRLVSALAQVRAEARELLAVSDSALALPTAA